MRTAGNHGKPPPKPKRLRRCKKVNGRCTSPRRKKR